MEQLGAARRDDAQARRGDARPARHRRAARPCRCASCRGGQQQRVAIGSVLTAHPRVLVLDEPTSALDPTGAEEVLATITRLVHDLGVTVVVAEHRLERVCSTPTASCTCSPTATVRVAALPSDLMVDSDSRAAGRRARPATPAGRRCRCRCATPAGRAAACAPASPATRPRTDRPVRSSHAADARSVAAASARDVVVRYRATCVAVREVDLDLRAGEVAALMGRNGSRQVVAAVGAAGQRRPDVGHGATRRRRRRATRHRPSTAQPGAERRRWSASCRRPPPTCSTSTPSAPSATQADRESGVPSGTCARAARARSHPASPREQHPRDLSEGQKLALVLAVQLTADPPVLLLDEPTRGLDYHRQGRA